MDATNNVSSELMKALEENDALAVDVGALKVSDEYTFKHSVDVASMGMIIAKNRGLSRRKCSRLVFQDFCTTLVNPESRMKF